MAESGLVYISGKEWGDLLEKMKLLKVTTAHEADKMVAFIGAEGRRAVGEAEKQAGFRFGASLTKWNSKAGKYETKQRTFMDSDHGWYKTSDGRRMVWFSYENTTHASLVRGKIRKVSGSSLMRSVSEGYVGSRIANLWNRPVHYSKNSPLWTSRRGNLNRWHAGITRSARVTLTRKVVETKVGPAMVRAEKDLDRLLHEEGLK